MVPVANAFSSSSPSDGHFLYENVSMVDKCRGCGGRCLDALPGTPEPGQILTESSLAPIFPTLDQTASHPAVLWIQ